MSEYLLTKAAEAGYVMMMTALQLLRAEFKWSEESVQKMIRQWEERMRGEHWKDDGL